MAKKSGIIKLEGTIGDISFYKSSEGYFAREKGGVDANRIANDPAFQRTRENGQEFGRAGKSGRLIRSCFRLLLQNTRDKRVASRLTGRLLSIIKTDEVNMRGLRTVQDGQMQLLQDFEFNKNARFNMLFNVNYQVNIDAATGEVEMSYSDFKPINLIDAPQGTTHFKISLGAGAIDFDNEESEFEMAETSIIAYDNAETAADVLTSTLSANTGLPIIAVLGISFYQEVNGTTYPLKNGAYNALSIVKVNQA
ncbi:MAG: hypothetical protein L0J35_05645 [Tetragenococcus halophilus]|nr:hypothetical protein [Tetragenococcus halophilus]